MAVVYITGFEMGLGVSAGNGLALGSPSLSNTSIDATSKKNGGYGSHMNTAGANIAVRAFFTISASTCNVGFWMQLVSLPSGDRKLFTIQGATNEDMVLIFDQATGKLGGLDPVNGKIGVYSSCPVLSAGTWYWIALKSDRSANQLSLTITPDGGSATDCGALTNATGWTANNGWVAIGNDSAQAGAVEAYFDDIIICSGTTEYPLGPHEVLGLLPGADGTHNVAGTEYIDGDTATTPNFTNSTTDAYTRLDDAFPWTNTRKTTGNISCEVHSAGTYLEIAPATAASGKSDAVAVRAILGYSSVTSTANNGSATVVRNSDGTENTIRGNFTTGADYSETSNFYNYAMVTAPAAGWTKTEIEAIRWRIGRASNSSDISPRPTWQQLMLEIAYEIAAGNTYEKTGGGVLVASDSGADVSAFTEAGTGTSPRIGSGLDAFFPTERGSGILSMSGGGVAAKAGITYTKAGSGIINMAASGADACTFSESGAGVSARVGSGADATAFTEAGAGISAHVGSGAKAVVYTKRGSGVLNASASGSKSLAGGATYVKAGAGISAFSGSGSKAVNFSETGSGVLNFSGSGSETKTAGATYTKAGSGVMVLTGSGVKARVLTKTGSGVLVRSGSGAKAVVYGESGSGQAVFFGSGSRQVVHERRGAGVLDLSGGGVTDKAVPVVKFFGRPSPGSLVDEGVFTAAVFGDASPNGPTDVGRITAAIFALPTPGEVQA